MKKIKNFNLYLGSVSKYRISDKLIFAFLSIFLVYSTILIIIQLKEVAFIEVPAQKGSLVEGVLGYPLSLNPLFAKSIAEKDISYLLHKTLIRNPNGLEILPGIADSWNVSDNGLIYTFLINSKSKFHNGNYVTARDVVFTINLLDHIDSPIADEWVGIVAKEISTNKVEILLPIQNPDFIYQADIPILPYEKWHKVHPEDLKTYSSIGSTIGAGIYKFKNQTKTIDGLITQIYLEKADKTLDKPYIQNIIFNYYENRNDLVEAFESGFIDSISNVTPTDLKFILSSQNKTFTILSGLSNRVFGLFYNNSDDSVFADIFLRGIFSEVINKKNIIDDVFLGFASPLNGPEPTDILSEQSDIYIPALEKTLDDLNWVKNDNNIRENGNGDLLEIRIVIPDAEEFHKIAKHIKESFESIGAEITLEKLSFNEIASLESIRGYDAILYGYTYQYKSTGIRDIWSKDAFIPQLIGFGEISTSLNNNSLQKENFLYNDIKKSIITNIPSVFIYSPHFVYVFNKPIYTVMERSVNSNAIYTKLDRLNSPSDRFNTILEWYIDTKNIFILNSKPIK